MTFQPCPECEGTRLTREALSSKVEGKNIVMFDDVVTTARTLCQAAVAMRKQGALDIYAGVTHGVFCPGAFERIADSPIKEVVVTDTLNHDPDSLSR